MALNLLNSFGRRGVSYGLYTKQADVLDTEYLSRYFVVSEFSPIFTAGKNSVSFNGSTYLKAGTQIFVECLDSHGNNLYIEMAKSSTSVVTYAYKEATAFVFSIYVYGDTVDGVGKLILYGNLIDGRTVKWQQNITINKSLKNDSRVRFYQPPILEVDAADVPVLSSTISTGLINNEQFTGKITGLAINPPIDTNLSTVNNRNVNTDYRLILKLPVVTNSTPDTNAFNFQMVNSTVNLNIHSIQKPLSKTVIPISATASYTITNVIDNHTLQVAIPYYYKDSYGNTTVTNITDADFSISYPFVNYNDATSSYQTTTIGGNTYIVQQSYADVVYRNIRTFSGYVARHKVYRKSLLSNGDYSIVADEPVVVNEILEDDLTQNQYYNLLGKFYNAQHIGRYWFTSSNYLSMSYTPSVAINTTFLSSPSYTSLSGSDYLMVKNDSVNTNRNAGYIPFDMTQFLAESGFSYDSNFMQFKANVQYIVEVSAIIIKDSSETNASLMFYITGSVPSIQQEKKYTTNFGVNIANITSSQAGISSLNIDDQISFFTPQNDWYGTLVVVPRLCQAYIKNISVRVYGDDGFSPDVFITRIPWPVAVANETFAIKAELFDVNSNLVHSDFNTIQSFDPSGSTLIPYIPGGGSANNLYISGTLTVSQSIIIQQGDLYIPNILPRPTGPPISQSRILSVRADGAIVWDPIVDISSDNEYLYLSTDNASGRLDTNITTRQSLASVYNSVGGRKIYWISGVKTIETSP